MMSASAHAWIEHAERDLEIASRGEFPDDACYHAQQATEKALKALLAERGEEVPRHHRLTNLLNILDAWVEFPPMFRDHCLLLEQYYLATRYPDIPEEPARLFTSEDAAEALRAARAIVTFVKSALKDGRRGRQPK